MDRLPGQRGDRDNPQEESGIPGAKIPSPLLHPTSSRSLARTCSSISSSTGATSYVYLEGPSRSGEGSPHPETSEPQTPSPRASAPQNPPTQHPKLSPNNAHGISTSTGGYIRGVRTGFWRVLSHLGSSTPPKLSLQTSAPQNPPTAPPTPSAPGAPCRWIWGRGGHIRFLGGSPHPPAQGYRRLTGSC